MNRLSQVEEVIYNKGERLIPGVTHDYREVRRHFGSYYFFREAIEVDRRRGLLGSSIRIVDLGCGVGHGCATLSEIPGARVVGVDMSDESLAYAQAKYSQPNIQWLKSDLPAFIQGMDEFDYVVSRGVIEHIVNGIEFVHGSRWAKRLMFDVPYAEPAGRNPHHLIHEIREETFDPFENAELFFQDLDGSIYGRADKPTRSNMIMCCCRAPHLPKLEEAIPLPYAPDWEAVGAVACPTESELAAAAVAAQAAKAAATKPSMFRRLVRLFKR